MECESEHRVYVCSASYFFSILFFADGILAELLTSVYFPCPRVAHASKPKLVVAMRDWGQEQIDKWGVHNQCVTTMKHRPVENSMQTVGNYGYG